jgi:hypothetical protein
MNLKIRFQLVDFLSDFDVLSLDALHLVLAGDLMQTERSLISKLTRSLGDA